MSERLACVVVGAGISGLAYAERLGAERCVVLEANDRVGGLIQTRTEACGVRHELGPETISGGSGAARTLAEALGLSIQSAPRAAQKRYLARGGRLAEVPMSPARLLLGGLLPLSARLRLMTEPFRSARGGLDGSVAEFMQHRVGRGVLERMVDPMLSGIHGAAPGELSMRACFPALVSGVEQYGSLLGYLRARRRSGGAGDARPWRPAGGMQRLPEGLAAKLGARLRLRSPVQGIERAGDGWRVHTSSQIYEAKRLVLATPRPAAAKLLAAVCLPAARELAEAPAESLIVHAALFGRADVEHALDGFGYLVPSAEGRQHLGTLFSSSLDPSAAPEGQVLLRTMLGGSRWPELQLASDARLSELVAHEVHPLLGIRAKPLFSSSTRHVYALPRYDLEHLARLDRVEAALPDGLSLLGNYRRGIGIPSLVQQAHELADEHLS